MTKRMEEEFEIFCLLLIDGTTLISKIEELYVDIGKPDCKLIDPFVIDGGNSEQFYLKKWLDNLTSDGSILINSDKILTLVSPKQQILNKYLEIIK